MSRLPQSGRNSLNLITRPLLPLPDPLMATLMRNPVILPVSRVTVDQSTIRAVLLSNNKDPFNNVPLKFEDCIPNEDLKQRIDEWVAQGKEPSNSRETVSMDVDEVAGRAE